jgi:hypothetical protein
VNHADRFHSKLSPSGAKRFMACPGSIRLSEGIPRRDSVFSAEGTAAHELAEKCLTTGFDAAKYLGEKIGEFEVTDEMAHAVQSYVDYVRGFIERGWVVTLEERVDLGHIVDGMSGTADCYAYKDGHLFVIEYKHGRGVAVEVDQNPQPMCYGLGVMKRLGNQAKFTKVSLTIVQPRASHPRGGIRTWETTPARLEEFAGELADAAFATLDPDAPLVPGEWCQFCPAADANVCPALKEQALALAAEEFEDASYAGLSNEELGDLLDKVSNVETWCKKLREYANAQAKVGRMPIGYKWVEKRATRKWSDEESVAANLRLVMDFTDEQIFERKLKSPPQIEKLVGKKDFGVLRPLIVQQSSGLVLAPLGDPRPEAQPNAASEFEAVSMDDE